MTKEKPEEPTLTRTQSRGQAWIELEGSLADLHTRMQSGCYRAKPTQRIYIPKADGRQRPIGIATLDHGSLMKFVEHRVADPRMLHLIRKWLRAGVCEDGEWFRRSVGVPQGADAR